MNWNNARDNLRIFYRREKEGDLVATFKGNLILDKVLKQLTIDILVPTWLNSIPLLRRNWINPILTPYCVIFKFIKVLQSRFSLIPKFLWKAKHWCLAFLWSPWREKIYITTAHLNSHSKIAFLCLYQSW